MSDDLTYLPTKCPVCSGRLLDTGRSLYCPAEDPHPGGWLMFDDGLVRTWAIANGDRLKPHPKEEAPGREQMLLHREPDP
jgi:hypothetical protein